MLGGFLVYSSSILLADNIFRVIEFSYTLENFAVHNSRLHTYGLFRM